MGAARPHLDTISKISARNSVLLVRPTIMASEKNTRSIEEVGNELTPNAVVSEKAVYRDSE